MGSVIERPCRCKKCREGKKAHPGIWTLRYVDRNGELKQEAVGRKGPMTKTIAKAILEKREREAKLGEEGLSEREIPTFDEITPNYLQYQREVKQIRSIDRTSQALAHFSGLFGNKKLSEITPADINTFIQRRRKDGRKLNTIARDLTCVKNLFNHAYRHKKFYGRNPVSEVRLPQVNDRKERVLTEAEQAALLKHCGSDTVADMITIALNTGMRRDEVLFLRWEWIDLQNGFISIPHTHSKSKRGRRVPINATVRGIFIECSLESGRPVEGAVFNLSSTENGARTCLQREFKEACSKADIEGLRFHDLRHSAATRLVEAGIPLHAVAELLGHSSVRMTERYSHPQESVIRATEVLGTFSDSTGDHTGDHKKDLQQKPL